MKNKCKVEISGIELSILSDNSESQVKEMSRSLDRRIKELTDLPYHYTLTEAAIICALDFLEESKRLEKTVHQLTHKLESQNLDIEILKIENEKLGAKK